MLFCNRGNHIIGSSAQCDLNGLSMAETFTFHKHFNYKLFGMHSCSNLINFETKVDQIIQSLECSTNTVRNEGFVRSLRIRWENWYWFFKKNRKSDNERKNSMNLRQMTSFIRSIINLTWCVWSSEKRKKNQVFM